MKPLSNIRVIELSTGIAGAYSAKLFADAGADVIKVEPPGGDPLRRWSASGANLGDRDGALFRYLAASKRSVTGSLGDPEIDALIHGSDLVIENAAPGVLEASGLLEQPGLVVLSITPYGSRSSWNARPVTDFILQAESGSTAMRAEPEDPPLYNGGHLSEWLAGTFGGAPALAAVYHAQRTGRGAHIDLSALETLTLCGTLFSAVMNSLTGGGAEPAGPRRRIQFPAIRKTSDGWVGFNTNTQAMFDGFLLLVERADLVGQVAAGTLANFAGRAELERDIDTWMIQRTSKEVLALAVELRIPVAPVGNGKTLPEIDHLVARGFYQVDPEQGYTRPASPYRINGKRPDAPWGPSPTAGEHTGRVEQREKVVPPERGKASELPLAGLKVLDSTAWWAGPGATMFLAAMGADVIHVESVKRPDGMRTVAYFAREQERWWEFSSIFLGANAGKRDITLNIDEPRGNELFRRLIRWADVVVENYTPRVFDDNFGLTWDEVHAENPRVLLARLPAFGLDGPWRERSGFAQTMEQLSGMAWVSGWPDGPPVIPGGVCDPVGFMHAAFSMQVALVGVRESGAGALLESPQAEGVLNLAAEQVLEYSAYGTLLTREGNRGPGYAPQGLYACQGVEQWLAVSVATDEQWEGLRSALGEPEWALDPVLATYAGRRKRHDLLDERLGAWAGGQLLDEAVELLIRHGVPAGRVTASHETLRHPAHLERGFIETVEHPVVGTFQIWGFPFRYSGIGSWMSRPSPTLGQHNREVLSTILGLSDAEIDELEETHAIGQAPLGMS